jgi:c-di-GMP-binding flagellar brake protein YcgR
LSCRVACHLVAQAIVDDLHVVRLNEECEARKFLGFKFSKVAQIKFRILQNFAFLRNW